MTCLEAINIDILVKNHFNNFEKYLFIFIISELNHSLFYDDLL